MKNLIKKTFFMVGAGIFGSVTILIIAVVILLQWPGIILNPTSLQWGAQWLRKSGLELQWTVGKVETKSISFFEKLIRVEFKEICWKQTEVNGCFSEAQFEFGINTAAFPPKITILGPLFLKGGKIGVTLQKQEAGRVSAPKAQPRARFSTPSWVPSWLKETRIGDVGIDVENWSFRTTGISLSGNLFVKRSETNGNSTWQIRLEEQTTQGSPRQKGRAVLDMTSAGGAWAGPWTIKGNAQASFRNGAKGEMLVRVLPEIRQITETEFQLALNGEVSGISNSVSRIRVAQCRVRFGAPQVTGQGYFRMDCPVSTRVKLPPIRQIPDLRLPSELHGRVTADLSMASWLPDPSNPVAGTVRLEFDPTVTGLLEADGRLEMHIEGVPTEFPQDWKAASDISLRLRVPRFEDAVTSMRAGDWAVPAPFDAMSGVVEVLVSGRADEVGGEFPITAKTRLVSKFQKLYLDAGAMLSLKHPLFHKSVSPQVSLVTDVVLSDVRLALPRLNMAAPPQLLPDERIEVPEKEQEEAGPPVFRYRLRFRTPQNRVAMVLSNLAQAPVPVSLDLALGSEEPFSGHIQLQDFPLELFRRDARVEQLRVGFDPEQTETDLDATIQLTYTDYLIRVLLSGTVEKPQMNFVSEPPVPEDQLAAVLLFGRPLEELDSDQTESLGSARAAFADGAVGLTSLYLLASTPIESVGYDPQTGVLSAKLRLGLGTSLNLEAGHGELQNVGIRKRLSKYWTVTTDLGALTESSSREVSAFLEWSSRY